MNPPGYWSKERCRQEALQFKTRGAFFAGSSIAYGRASKNGWMDEICSHMPPPRKKRGYWLNKENCRKEALLHDTVQQFRTSNDAAYNTIKERGWYEELCSHLRQLRKPLGYWSVLEHCHREARKYKSRKEFKTGNGTAYKAACENKFIDKICGHMISSRRPDGYWTKARCRDEAKKYQTRTRFMEGSGAAYGKSHRNGWLDEICGHMSSPVKPHGYWTKARCHDEAKKYRTRTRFMEGSGAAYGKAHRKGWLDDICGHMESGGTNGLYCVYAISNERLKQAYIGVTLYMPRRQRAHFSDNNDCRSRQITDLDGTRIEQLSDYIYSKDDVRRIEKATSKKYQQKGFRILNDPSRFGVLPKPKVIYTKSYCKELALKYENLKEFSNSEPGAYVKIHSHGWQQECMSHLRRRRQWELSSALALAKDCTSIRAFITKHYGAYTFLKRNGWLASLYEILPRKKRPNRSLTKEGCQEIALAYSDYTAFLKEENSVVTTARRLGILKQITSHMRRRVTHTLKRPK